MGGFTSRNHSLEEDIQVEYGVTSREYGNGEDQKHFRTLVYRKRKLSDSALTGVMLDPLVSDVFRNFVSKRFAETLLAFWTECTEYDQIPSNNVEKKKAKAVTIYAKYISEETKSEELRLNTLVRETIKEELKIQQKVTKDSTSYTSKQSNPDILRDVFKFAAQQVFHILKFEHLPAFVESEEFTTMGLQDHFDDYEHAKGMMNSLVEEINTAFLVAHPIGLHYLAKFFRSEGIYGADGGKLFELMYEIQDFEKAQSKDHRKRRLQSIISKYKILKMLPALADLIEKIEKDNEKSFDSKLHIDLFSDVRKEIILLVEKQVKKFKETDYFFYLKERIADPTTATIEDKRRLSTKKTIKELQDFASKRTTITGLETATLADILKYSVGISYFKKFATTCFMEDAMRFWMDVQTFKKEYGSSDADMKKSREMAHCIINEYVVKGSAMEINVGDKIRGAIEEAFKHSCPNTLFDVAEAEILRLLENNLWQKFQSSSMFGMLQARIKEKKMRAGT